MKKKMGIILLLLLFACLGISCGWKEKKSVKHEKQEKQDASDLESYFYVKEIDEDLKGQMLGKSYIENQQIAWEDLRYVGVLHYNFNHETQVGELVVNKDIAEDCKEIFYELYQNEYEINAIHLVDAYYDVSDQEVQQAMAEMQSGNGTLRAQLAEAADVNSINNDNTSAFHYRLIAGTDVLSKHARGMAIDVNPRENPTMAVAGKGKYVDAEQYEDRTSGKAHVMTEDDICVQIFKKHGFAWGGDWTTPDYQHFEK